MKVFISQPMATKNKYEITQEREDALEDIKQMFPSTTLEVIESYISNAPYLDKPVWCLGKSLQLLSDAQLVYFCKGWEKARGCRIEHAVAEAYKIPHVEE